MGYDELASVYDAAFPTGYASAVERRVVALFADEVVAAGLSGAVADVGCGAGHVAADLASRGLEVVGVDPSHAMLDLARRRYPDLRWSAGDADLSSLPEGEALVGIVARYSLIHVEPERIPGVLATWARHLQIGARVLLAFQCSDDPDRPVLAFDHRVAPAWRWHPDAMASALEHAGLSERWRVVTPPDDADRFTECHLGFSRSASQRSPGPPRRLWRGGPGSHRSVPTSV